MDKINSDKIGKLFLLPSVISSGTTRNTIPQYNLECMQMLRVFVVENERTARRFLREAGVKTDFNEIEMLVLNEHTPENDIESLLQACRMGRDIGLLSESGLPCVADPGARLVLIARQEGIEIIPLSGPSSILLALIASGLNGQSFTFHGYLPIEKSSLGRKIKDIERKALN